MQLLHTQTVIITIRSHANQTSDVWGATGRDSVGQIQRRIHLNEWRQELRNQMFRSAKVERDDRVNWFGDALYFFKTVQRSVSQNELTIIHKSVTHRWDFLKLSPHCYRIPGVTSVAEPSSCRFASLCLRPISVNCFFYFSACLDRWDHC